MTANEKPKGGKDMTMNIPSGAMVEMTADLIGEGSMVREINQSLREAHAALGKRRDDFGKTDGACKITVEIEVGYDPEMRETVTIKHCVTLRTPKNAVLTLAKDKGGHLLCQPNGSSEDTPDQQRLFDGSGRPIGLVDRRTGELSEELPIAGKVGVGA